MIHPYEYVRLVTLGLGTTWTAFALVRIVRTAAGWQRRLEPLALDERWWRRHIALVCLRVTLLDPINLALLCALVALWTLPLHR